MKLSKEGVCTNCGMQIKIGEYHPEIACYAYKACGDRDKVAKMSEKLYGDLWAGGFGCGIEATPREVFDHKIRHNGMQPTHIRLIENKVFVDRCELSEENLENILESLRLAKSRATP